jgi:hypothetical protein
MRERERDWRSERISAQHIDRLSARPTLHPCCQCGRDSVLWRTEREWVCLACHAAGRLAVST